MSQVDEGLIHAWLDGQLSPDEAVRVERLVATDAAWGEAAAEARGVVAGASRILGALDDVPSVRSVEGMGGTTNRARRSVLRAPWLRAAAVLVFVAGVGGLLLQQHSSDQLLVAKGRSTGGDSVSLTQPQSAQNAIAERGVTAVPPIAKVDRRLDALRGGGAPSALPSATSSAAASVGIGAGAMRQMAVDSAKANALTLQKPVPLVEQGVIAGGVAGGRGGRAGAIGGGRGAASGLALPNVAAEMRDQAAAKSLAAPQAVDPRLSDCWLPVDSAPGGVSVLRFVEPTATDIQRVAAAPPGARPSSAATALSRALPRAPAGARVQNTSPRKFDADSLFTAEWITGNGRTNLIFTVHGDTLTGETHLAAGDIRYPGVPFRAARIQCPR